MSEESDTINYGKSKIYFIPIVIIICLIFIFWAAYQLDEKEALVRKVEESVTPEQILAVKEDMKETGMIKELKSFNGLIQNVYDIGWIKLDHTEYIQVVEIGVGSDNHRFICFIYKKQTSNGISCLQ